MSLAEREAKNNTPELTDEQLKLTEEYIQAITSYLEETAPPLLEEEDVSSFWEGFGSILELEPELPELDTIPEARSDFEEIRADWNAVGRDLYSAILEYLQEVADASKRGRRLGSGIRRPESREG